MSTDNQNNERGGRDYVPLTWEKRDDADSQMRAIEAISDGVAENLFVFESKDMDEVTEPLIVQAVEAYAVKWEVPFSLALFREMTDRQCLEGSWVKRD